MHFWANSGYYFLLILVKIAAVVTKRRQEIVENVGHSTTLNIAVSPVYDFLSYVLTISLLVPKPVSNPVGTEGLAPCSHTS